MILAETLRPMDDRPTDSGSTPPDTPATETPIFEADWVFEGSLDQSGKAMRTQPLAFPCRIGRNQDVGLTLPFSSVSGLHAEMFIEREALWLRDLGSTNGTFLNRQLVTEAAEVADGDVVHFGEHEMRLIRQQEAVPSQSMDSATLRLDLSQSRLPNRMPVGVRRLEDLLRQAGVEPHFQPIVELVDGSVVGHEILGRGAHPDLPVAPRELFQMAAEIGLEVPLSTLFRNRGVEIGLQRLPATTFYVNTHPQELCQPSELCASLAELRGRHAEASLVLEVHESAILDLSEIRGLRDTLRELDIRLAYDDFGAGRSRLAELLEAPPDVVKFDMSIVRDLHLAKPSKVKMIGSLVTMLLAAGVACLAEGVEVEGEATICRELGFQLGQGFYFGHPEPA